MRVQTADDAKRWLANKGGRWREQRTADRVTVIAAVNDLAEATANLGA